MAKRSGLGMRFFVDGINLSGDIGAINRIAGGPAAMDVTGIDKEAPERIGGVRDGGIEASAWFNPATGQAHETFAALPTGDRLVSALVGTAIGDPGASVLAKQINYDGSRANDGALSYGVQDLANGFGLEWGELHTAALRTDTAATNGAGVDAIPDAAATAFGVQAYLHVAAFTGTSAVVKLQESSDNGAGDAFADVSGGAFVAVTTAPQAQRIGTGTQAIERYLRVVTTGTFSELAFFVIVVRNQVVAAF